MNVASDLRSLLHARGAGGNHLSSYSIAHESGYSQPCEALSLSFSPLEYTIGLLDGQKAARNCHTVCSRRDAWLRLHDGVGSPVAVLANRIVPGMDAIYDETEP